MKTLEERIAVLKVHREGLAIASSFEAFKTQQLAFVEFLIEDMEADLKSEEVVLKWMARVEL